MSVRKNQYFD
jgi:hypothetical protein